VGRLERRIKNLEDCSGRECPECGFDGDWSKVKFEVEFWDGDEEHTGPEETTYCESCGAPAHIVLTWGDDRA
jgi:hypothetical protein